MKIRATSHIAIGVRNMERSLHFYRDLLGLRVTLDDPQENPGGMLSSVTGSQQPTRHGVYLRWEDGLDATFIVLSENRPTSGEAIKLTQVGIHHFAFWVDDLQETYEKVKAAGVPIVLPPTAVDTVAYGEPPGGKVLTTLFKDPDGIVVQLDQRL
ncbi:MAG: VOC family protein [Deltaproteobacteria bacterium]|nr:VOC family protein [Deltaproteobacteria bacterium]